MTHVHDWIPGVDRGDYFCPDCEATTNACNTCDRPTGTELLVCARCLDRERKVLIDIDDALSHYTEAPPTQLKAVRYDKDRINGTPTANDDPTKIETPADVLDVLDSWAEAWAEARGGEVAYYGDAMGYLRTHILWAAQNPDVSGWHDYRQETRTMRHHARRIAGLLPNRVLAPCLHCGGTVVQDWADENWQPRTGDEPEHRGISDTLRCTGCHTTWNDRDWLTHSVVEAKIHTGDLNPEALVTEPQARRLLPDLGESTIRSWIRRDRKRAEEAQRTGHDYKRRIPERGKNTLGRTLYKLGDIQQHADTDVVDIPA